MIKYIYKLRFLVVIGIMASSLWVPAFAGYYVSPSGNDMNNGTSVSSAWKTIGHAASIAVAGDIVNVLAGTYTENISLTRSGTSSAYITFQSSPTLAAIINGTISGNANYIKIIGFEVRNGSGVGIHLSGSYPSSGYVEIRKNHVHDMTVNDWGGGIGLHSYSHFIIDSNEVNNN